VIIGNTLLATIMQALWHKKWMGRRIVIIVRVRLKYKTITYIIYKCLAILKALGWLNLASLPNCPNYPSNNKSKISKSFREWIGKSHSPKIRDISPSRFLLYRLFKPQELVVFSGSSRSNCTSPTLRLIKYTKAKSN